MLDKTKTVVALGYFDSVHKGHQKVMQTAGRYAKEQGASFCVITFDGNLKTALGFNEEKNVYTKSERERLIKSIGADTIYFAPVTKDFLSKSATEFLDFINQKFDIIAYVSGSDYRFGKNGEGNVEFLKSYAKSHSQTCITEELESEGGEKISTTRIKELLSNGKIEKANELLGRAFSVTGTVFSDRQVGRKLGFPTININVDSEKVKLYSGVYKGRVNIDNKEYKVIANYGARPTFNLSSSLVEAHILDFNGDLYEKEITVKFDKFIREIIKFESQEQLALQIKSDLSAVKEGKYD